MNTSFFGELLQTISDRGRALLDRGRDRRGDASARSENLIELCEHLLSGRGEASGVALAREILGHYAELTIGPRIAFFEALAQRFGTDPARMDEAIAAWRAQPSDATAADVHAASEPRRQELFRRLNLAPGGTRALVRMREQLIDVLGKRAELAPVNDDFVHLFTSWFNRGFLVLRHIDWSTPAIILEKIIRYEAVHEIRDWDDLRRRIDPPDRRCYAFFHPALVDEPLIFVEVALERDIPGAIAPILASGRLEFVPLEKARVAVFYSISNCQRGLAGVSFGNFLIKQVVEEIRRELPKLTTFVTLSPVPNFARWLAREAANETSTVLNDSERAALTLMERPHWWTDPEIFTKLEDPLRRAAAFYYLRAKTPAGLPVDAVARFHLGNGARLERINWLGDTSDKAIAQGHGLMVNYLYELDDIEKNHEAYAEGRTVVASNTVQRMLRPSLELVPIAG
ncbi:MAG: malonyl-CoA decarboxylase [Pseudolabrys sp.]|nr:malonyl-CoA decarboxylase [Pseudolabrys sp.]MDP2294469.1 malonyl-CoA decarboxylase [Pseudolabrys sp.]